jgi:tetratricopeptide (TPR) repeat protein
VGADVYDSGGSVDYCTCEGDVGAVGVEVGRSVVGGGGGVCVVVNEVLEVCFESVLECQFVEEVMKMSLRKKLMGELKEAIEVREKGDLEKSKRSFEKLLGQVESLRDSSYLEDQRAYVLVMSEGVIQLRHEGKRVMTEALGIARELYKYARLKRLDDYRAVRAVSNTLIDLGDYEGAEAYLREMLSLIPAGDSAKIGDTKAHLARCLFRMGRLQEVEMIIDEAIEGIDENTSGWSKMHIAVWKSHALMVKALIFNVRSEREKALRFAKEALGLAKKQGLAVRVGEARSLVECLSVSQ